MNATQSAILRALELAKILDTEHESGDVHRAFRAVRHELRALRDLHCPQAPEQGPQSVSALTGRATTPNSLRHLILGVLKVCPMADFQTAECLRSPVRTPSPSLRQVSRRRHELMAAGWVEFAPSTTGQVAAKVRQEATGRDCTVYRLTLAGSTALSRLDSGQVALFTDSDLSNDSASKPDKVRGCDVGGTYESGEAITAESSGVES